MTWVEHRRPLLGPMGVLIRTRLDEAPSTWMDWQAFFVSAWPESDPTRWEFVPSRVAVSASGARGMGLTADLEHADVAAHGHVKWDGCGEIQVPQFHACGVAHARALSALISEVWEIAATQIERWNAETAQ